MPNDKKGLITPKITGYTIIDSSATKETSKSKKRHLSTISPSKETPHTKSRKSQKPKDSITMDIKEGQPSSSSQQTPSLEGLQVLLNPLIAEVRALKEDINRNSNQLDEKYKQLEESISIQNETTTKDFKDLKELLMKQQCE